MIKIRLKEKHWELGKHYTRFVDRRWYPDFVLSEESLKIFIGVESAGKGAFTDEELKVASPLFNGKTQRELTVKLMFDEMAEWWSMGYGWYYPIAHTIHCEMWQHGSQNRDKVFIRALVKIMRSCHKEGFLDTMIRFTGMPQSDKNRYLSQWLGNNKTK